MTTEEKIISLINRVMEVIGNNDWPTEEGQRTAEGPTCYIEQLCIDIINDLRPLKPL